MKPATARSSSGLPLIYGEFNNDILAVNGSLGVGTSSPSEKLEVNGNAKADTVFASAFSSNSPLQLQTDGTTRIYVDDVTGNVGIGTITPAADLEVKGTILAENGTSINEISTDGSLSDNSDDAVPTEKAVKAYIDALEARIAELEALNFTCGDYILDIRDGNTYATVQISTQCWIAENLAYLPSVSPSSAGSSSNPYYYVYDYQGTSVTAAKATSNYQTYGVLYNWPAAMAGAGSSNSVPSGVQGACPDGWHLPSHAEWTLLTDSLGGASVAGGKMKETGTTHWNYQNTGATNSSGFTALPGGDRGYNNSFYSLGNYAYFLSSSEYFGGFSAYYRYLSYNNSSVYQAYNNKYFGFSVRCLRD